MPSGANGRPAEDRDSNERTPLISQSSLLGNTSRLTTNRDGEPLSQDHRAWVRMPSNFVRLTWLTLASNYVNVLLVCVPAGIIVGAMDLNPTAVFIINFFAIVPLAGLLSFATEELSVKLGQTIGGLMNATFGNAVELIVSRRTDGVECRTIADMRRSRLLLYAKERFGLCRLVCLVQSCRTSC